MEGPNSLCYGSLPVSQIPDTSAISGPGGFVDLHLEKIMAEFAVVFQLNFHRHVLKNKNKNGIIIIIDKAEIRYCTMS